VVQLYLTASAQEETPGYQLEIFVWRLTSAEPSALVCGPVMMPMALF